MQDCRCLREERERHPRWEMARGELAQEARQAGEVSLRCAGKGDEALDAGGGGVEDPVWPVRFAMVVPASVAEEPARELEAMFVLALGEEDEERDSAAEVEGGCSRCFLVVGVPRTVTGRLLHTGAREGYK